MAWKPGKSHLVGVILTVIVAIILLVTLFPYLNRIVFPGARRGRSAIQLEPFYYLALALIPVVMWGIPPILRALARGTLAAHGTINRRSGFYVRFPIPKKVRFRDTLLMALGPFAIDLLVITEVEYFFSTPDVSALGRGLITVPALLILAGFITAIIPGPWLVDALGIRFVNPSKGEAVRAAALVDGILGPIAAIALLVSFVTTLHQADYSYEQGILSLGEWAVRLFPPVLAAVSIFRIVVEPDVMPSLEDWCKKEGIEVRTSLAEALSKLRPATARSSASVGS
ncbi:MAG: hypothetical protein LUO85_04780, partial [Methanomassiliicoccales archaeon]|nr:hypothetical protein [Methanomassiliicoccales archaeon]